MTVLDQDTFTRANQTGWGTASGGSTYTFNGTTQSSVASIVSNQGKVTNTGANSTIFLGSGTAKDGIISVRQLIDHAGGASGVVFRATSANTYYRAYVIFGNAFYLDKTVGGTTTTLASLVFGYATTDEVWIKLRVQGSSLAAKVWIDGNSEPTNWSLYAVDTDITAAGQYGLRSKPGGTSNAIYYDSLTVTDLSQSYTTIAQSKFLTRLSSSTKSLLAQAQSTFLNRYTVAPAGAAHAPINPAPHICIVALENHGYDAATGAKFIVGNGNFTHLNSLRTTYQSATNFDATSHDSLPNYLAFAQGLSHDTDANVSGDTYNPLPVAQGGNGPLLGNTLVDSLAAKGIAWKHYQENLPSTGYLGSWSTGGNGDSGSYNAGTLFTAHHNPWIYYSSIRTNTTQASNIVNYSQLQTDLTNGNAPPFFFVVPSNNHNGHGGGSDTQTTIDTNCDNWVNTFVSMVQASTWYTQGNGHIILWFDESNKPDLSGVPGSDAGNGSAGGHCYCVVISSHNNGTAYTTNFNHFGLLKAIEDQYGLSYLNNDAHTSNGDASGLFTAAPPPPPPPPQTGISPYGVTVQNANTGVWPYTDTLIADCGTIGVGRIRYQQDWLNIEPTQGNFDWTGLDEMIGKCNAHGISVCFPIRDIQGGPASWFMTELRNPGQTNRTTCANGNFTNDHIYGSDPTLMGVFAGKVAARYNGSTIPNPYKSGSFLFLDAIEIGNEEYDGKHDCNTATGVGYLGEEARDPKWYPPAVFACAPAIRAASPNTLVGQWGMWWKDITHREAVMTKLYTTTDTHGKTAASYLDYFNFHLYIGDPYQDENTNSVSLPHILNDLWAITNGTYHDTKHFRITEIGWSAQEITGNAGDPTWAQMQTYYQEAMDIMRTSGKVDGFDLYTMAYSPSPTSSVAQGKSLTNPAGVSPHFQPPAFTIQSYSQTYPSWTGVYNLSVASRAKFRNIYAGLKAWVHSPFKTRTALKSKAASHFSISDGLKHLKAFAQSAFQTRTALKGNTRSIFSVSTGLLNLVTQAYNQFSMKAVTFTIQVPRVFGGTVTITGFWKQLTNGVRSIFSIGENYQPHAEDTFKGVDGNDTFTI